MKYHTEKVLNIKKLAVLELAVQSNISKIVKIGKDYKALVEKDLGHDYDTILKNLIYDATNTDVAPIYNDKDVSRLMQRVNKFIIRVNNLDEDIDGKFVKGFKIPDSCTHQPRVIFRSAVSEINKFNITGLFDSTLSMVQLPKVIQDLEVKKLTSNNSDKEIINIEIENSKLKYSQWTDIIKPSLNSTLNQLGIQGVTLFEKIINLELCAVHENDDNRRRRLQRLLINAHINNCLDHTDHLKPINSLY